MATQPQSKMLGEVPCIEALKTLIQKDEDSSEKLAQEVKHHEDNLKYLKSHVNIVDESIHHLRGELKECHLSSMAVVEDSTILISNTEKPTADQMRKLDKTAASLICKLKDRHVSMLSTLNCTKDVLGIVASLGKVDDDNLSRILSEYLGTETMSALVCKTLDGVLALENYEEDGTIDRNVGLHAVAPTIGRELDDDGRGLRETLFFNLFSRLQVYKTRNDMIGALPFISDGAISLDGGIIKSDGLFYLGDRANLDARFPIVVVRQNPLKEAAEIEQKIKFMEWKKQMLSSDIQREETLINNAKCVLKTKCDGFKKLVNDEILNKELMKHISKAKSPRS